MTDRRRTTTRAADAPIDRLDRALAEAAGVSRGEARRWIDVGAAFVDGRRCRVASRPVGPGAELTWTPGADLLPEGPAARWVVRSDGFGIVDKPAGMPTDATTASIRGTLAQWLRDQGHRHVTLPHRLDRETRGLLLVSLAPEHDAALAALVQERAIERTYRALVSGRLVGAGRWSHGAVTRAGRRVAVPIERGGAPMHTRWRALGARAGQPTTALELTLETGRTHQIRLQCAAEGHPILGDTRYGQAHASGLHLVAWRLSMRHPTTGEALVAEIPLPPWALTEGPEGPS